MDWPRYIFAGLLILAGIWHFVKPQMYERIMPVYLPAHKLLVLLSGVAEIICGLLLLYAPTINIGAYLSIALLIAVFPANIEMARHYYETKKKGYWLALLRLPLQLVLIWWAYELIR